MKIKNISFAFLATLPFIEPYFTHEKKEELHTHPESEYPIKKPTGMVYGNINYDQANYSQQQTEARLVTVFLNDQS